MALSFHKYNMLSPPCEVWWAGFRTDTLRLQQAGWQIAVEELPYDGSIQMILRHTGHRVDALSKRVRHDYFHRDFGAQPTFEITNFVAMGQLRFMGKAHYTQIDAEPQFAMEEPKSIDDLKIFATPLTRTEEIIVEPETVQSLLDRIREMQAPEQAALRAKQRIQYAREEIEAGPRQKFHAQIISIAA